MIRNKWMIFYKDLKIAKSDNGYLLHQKNNRKAMRLDERNFQFVHRGAPIEKDTEFFKEAVAQYLINHYDELLKTYSKSDQGA